MKKIDRYGSREEFLRESIDLMITWWTDPQKSMFEKKCRIVGRLHTRDEEADKRNEPPEFYESEWRIPSGASTARTNHILEIFAEQEVLKNRNFLKSKRKFQFAKNVFQAATTADEQIAYEIFSIKNCHMSAGKSCCRKH